MTVPATKARKPARKPVAAPVLKPNVLTEADRDAIRALPILRTSERRDFKRCPQRWWWGWREGLKPNGDAAMALWFGTGIHLVMEHWYGPGGLKRGRNPMKVWREYAEDGGDMTMRTGELRAGDDRPEYVKAKALGEAMLSGYFELYGKDEHWFVIKAEKPFQIIIPSRLDRTKGAVIYAGKWDLLLRDLRDRELMKLIDHKTARDLSISHLALDDQGGSYWALATQYLRQTGEIGAKERLAGVEYNILRKYIPPEDDRPVNENGERLNLNGTVSARQPKTMDYRFLRHMIHRSPQEVQTQIKRIAIEIESMDRMRRDPELLFKTPTQDCSWDCSFKGMCELQERQTDWEEFKALAFHPEDPYADHRADIEAHNG